MKILAFGTSNSKHSINKKLAFYAAQQINNADVSLIDINDFEMPIYSEDKEKESGIPQLAHDFYNAIGEANTIIISFAEYNGSYTSAYKNLFDWTSRIDMKVFQNKAVIMLSTSPGPGGAQSVLATAQASAPYFAANLVGALSLPSFFDNFDSKQGVVTHNTFKQDLLSIISKLS
ncbi:MULTISPECIES: NADPH-dependent FMN reductase [Marinomonas]|uniref:NAD(P)H-dependent oxidoreductase n=1 Tax=Marinomonas arctica TaxID=383750 RepID=A0A7H1JAS7_9GAMM|nr:MULTISPECIES: NAD(P)H-dependent oxidoreductase [Marinomonas]MCS7486896.1 NADPH-dependent FMN reductase [Marinomonas sp. BSi20414]QNT07593.1 NAD(P)H-dependent oxidoreductase [Marinomonas arctica]GGN21100.1 FMN reductase [Marinomonas arctica]